MFDDDDATDESWLDNETRLSVVAFKRQDFSRKATLGAIVIIEPVCSALARVTCFFVTAATQSLAELSSARLERLAQSPPHERRCCRRRLKMLKVSERDCLVRWFTPQYCCSLGSGDRQNGCRCRCGHVGGGHHELSCYHAAAEIFSQNR